MGVIEEKGGFSFTRTKDRILYKNSIDEPLTDEDLIQIAWSLNEDNKLIRERADWTLEILDLLNVKLNNEGD